MKDLKQTLKQVCEHRQALNREQASGVLTAMLTGDVDDIEIAALLTAMATRRETVDELTGFAEAMRALAIPVPLTDEERAQLVDNLRHRWRWTGHLQHLHRCRAGGGLGRRKGG